MIFISELLLNHNIIIKDLLKLGRRRGHRIGKLLRNALPQKEHALIPNHRPNSDPEPKRGHLPQQLGHHIIQIIIELHNPLKPFYRSGVEMNFVVQLLALAKAVVELGVELGQV
jgi:hypothetical protein